LNSIQPFCARFLTQKVYHFGEKTWIFGDPFSEPFLSGKVDNFRVCLVSPILQHSAKNRLLNAELLSQVFYIYCRSLERPWQKVAHSMLKKVSGFGPKAGNLPTQIGKTYENISTLSERQI